MLMMVIMIGVLVVGGLMAVDTKERARARVIERDVVVRAYMDAGPCEKDEARERLQQLYHGK